MIELKNCIYKKDNFILDIKNIKIDNFSKVLIIGPSGGGKSTLLRILVGLEKNFEGELNIANEYKNFIAYLPQNYVLWDHLSVIEHINFVLNKGKSLKENKESIKYLKYLELEDKYNKKVYELSGGEKQRLALARVLSTKSKYIFLDEAFSNVDIVLARYLLKKIYTIQEIEKFSIVEVAHYGYLLKEHYIYVIIDGKISQEGSFDDISKNAKDVWTKKWLEFL